MTGVLLFALALPLQGTPAAAPPAAQPTQAATSVPDADAEALRLKLKSVKRIYVESFGEDTIAKQIQAMVVSSLAEAKRFIITENKDKADAVLKGAAVEKTSQEFHSNSESTSAARAGGHVSGNETSFHGGFGGTGVGIHDASASTETIDRARVAVRLVSADGDVIWATTQESAGAKYKGASADVADKIVKRLIRDIEKNDAKPGASQTSR